MAPANSQLLEQIARKSWRNNWRIRQQIPNPKPGDRAKGHFQAAGPVDSDWIGILALPIEPLAEKFRGELFSACEAIGFRERDQMLVAIEFPGDFRVAYLFDSPNSEYETRAFAALFSHGLHPDASQLSARKRAAQIPED